MTKHITLLVISFLIAGSVKVGAECAAISRDVFLYLEFGVQIKEPDGSLTQVIHIKKTNQPGKDADMPGSGSMLVLYRIRNGHAGDEGGFKRLDISRDGDREYVTITAASTCVADVYLIASSPGTRYVAHTRCYLFGNGPREEQANHNRDDMEPPLIKMDLVNPQINYWQQTGEPYAFKIDKKRTSPNPGNCAWVIDNGTCIEKIKIDAHGIFHYAPAHDNYLDRNGAQAYKSLVFYAKETHGPVGFRTTYTLLLHRSRYAHHNLRLGLLVACCTFTLILLTVICRRKRFSP